MVKKVLKRKRNWPILHLNISIPYLTVQTALWSDRMESNHRDYIMLNIQLFKWKFEIALYDTFVKITERSLD